MPKKGENIYKRKDNRWEARYIKGYHPDNSPQYGYCYSRQRKRLYRGHQRLQRDVFAAGSPEVRPCCGGY